MNQSFIKTIFFKLQAHILINLAKLGGPFEKYSAGHSLSITALN